MVLRGFPVYFFIFLIYLMGIPTHAQTTAAGETTEAATTNATEATEITTENMTTAVADAPGTTGPTETPGSGTTEPPQGTTAPAVSTQRAGTRGPTTPTEAPVTITTPASPGQTTPGTNTTAEEPGTSTPATPQGTATSATAPTNALTTAPDTAEPVTTTEPDPKKFEGEMRILMLDGSEAVFDPDYGELDSPKFTDLNNRFCTAVKAALENSTTGNDIEGCEVTKFTEGSIVATFVMSFPSSTDVTTNQLAESLKAGFTNPTNPLISDFGVELSSITVTEVIVVTVPPTEDPGLSAGAIAGIAVGSVAAVVIIVVLIVCIVKKTGRSGKIEDVEEQELRPSSPGKSTPPVEQVDNASEKSS